MEAPHEVDPRAISPELALVDPELTRLLRSQLAPAHWELPPPTAVRPIGPLVSPTAAPARKRTRRLLQSAAVAALALLATILALTIRDLVGSDPTRVSNTAPRNIRASAHSRAAPPQAKSHAQAKQAPAGKRTAQAPRAAKAHRGQVPTRAAEASSAPKRPTAAQAPQIRNLVWAPAAGARSYGVRVVRGTNVVFEGNTQEARLTLALRPGAYRWYVWALRADGMRSAQLVDASLVVTAEA